METAGCYGIFQGPDDEDGDHKTLAWLVVQREEISWNIQSEPIGSVSPRARSRWFVVVRSLS